MGKSENSGCSRNYWPDNWYIQTTTNLVNESKCVFKNKDISCPWP